MSERSDRRTLPQNSHLRTSSSSSFRERERKRKEVKKCPEARGYGGTGVALQAVNYLAGPQGQWGDGPIY